MHTPMPLTGDSRGLFITCVVLLAISLMTVSLRLFVRTVMIQAFGWDDVLMVIAMVIYVAFCVSFGGGAANGVGLHLTDFAPNMKQYGKALLWWWLGQISYIVSSAFTKLSIAMALHRLTLSKAHCLTINLVMGMVVTTSIAFFFVLIFYCHPVSHFWEQVNPTHQGKCLPGSVIVKVAYFYSACTIITDGTLAILPAFLIYNLHMSSRTKIAVSGILSMGALASIAVIIRLPFLHHYEDTDFLYSSIPLGLCTLIENGIGIIAGSLVTLRPLFCWFLDKSRIYSSGRERKISRNYGLSSIRLQKSDAIVYTNETIWPQDVEGRAHITTIASPQNNFTKTASQEHLDPLHVFTNAVNVRESFRVVTEKRQNSF